MRFTYQNGVKIFTPLTRVFFAQFCGGTQNSHHSVENDLHLCIKGNFYPLDFTVYKGTGRSLNQ